MNAARNRLVELAGRPIGIATSTGARKLAYRPLPSSADRREFGCCSWTMGAIERATPKGAVGVRAHLPPKVFDQGQTLSCEGHMHAAAIYAAFHAAGRPLFGDVPPSPHELYRNGVVIDTGPNVPFRDEGAYTSSVTRAANIMGVAPMIHLARDGRYSDCEPETIGAPLTLAEAEVERRTIPIGERSIADCSTGRHVAAVISDIRSALAAGYPVGFGAFVGSSFSYWTPADGPLGADDLTDPNGGGHAILFVESLDDGTLWGLNWWGESYGAKGFFRAGPAFVEQCTDLTVFVPELRS